MILWRGRNLIIRAHDVVQRHGYSDHFATMCVCACVYVSMIKTKTPDHNDLKLSTVVDLDRLLILGLKGQGLATQGHHFELLAPPSYLWNGCSYKVQILCTNASRAVIARGSKIMPQCGGCHRSIISCEKCIPHLHNALSNVNVK